MCVYTCVHILVCNVYVCVCVCAQFHGRRNFNESHFISLFLPNLCSSNNLWRWLFVVATGSCDLKEVEAHTQNSNGLKLFCLLIFVS